MKITLVCGYDYSKHTLALLHLLALEGIVVEECLIVSEYSVKRLTYFYKQLDRKEFVKKFKDRIFGNITSVKMSDEVKYILALCKQYNIKEKKVSAYCKNNNIRYKIVSNLNSTDTLQFIKGEDIAIYAGGGIIKKSFLSRFKIGVLNCHGGKLPEMRGMNVAEWSVLKGIPVVNTLHFMERDLDMGPIIEIIPHDFSSCKNIDQLRGVGIVYTIQDLVYGVKKIISNEYSLAIQKKEEGKQYFLMHPILKNIVNKKLLSSHV